MINTVVYPASKKQIELLKQSLESGYISENDYKKSLIDSKYAYDVIGSAMAKKRLNDSFRLINTSVNTIKNYDGRIYDHNEVVNIGIWDGYAMPVYCSDDM
ncbi:hypothetical protein [Clostridium sp. 1001283B150210_160208_E6]|uniref:hypothetical protein n=1 Tax=Clostridium sp. 1001283B150210_160208_E6 TaxID=2787129 RepID=UPI0018AAD940|nr:hypothetical protein [Clostridium sp. 1001283B150210_160208_E6]